MRLPGRGSVRKMAHDPLYPRGRPMKSTDVTVRDVQFGYEEYQYRTPIKFGGVALDRATILNVDMVVETRAGKTARGFGSMPLSNVWAYPTRKLPYDATLAAMQHVAGKVAELYRGAGPGHPI